MRRASELFGLPVVSLKDGRQAGQVKEILVDLESARLTALVLGGDLGETGLVPAERVFSFGEDAVTVEGHAPQVRGEQAARLRKNRWTLEQVRRLEVVTNAGNDVGNVEDLVLDKDRVLALELSGGLLEDLVTGRWVMQIPPEAVIGQDKIVIPDYHPPPKEHHRQDHVY